MSPLQGRTTLNYYFIKRTLKPRLVFLHLQDKLWSRIVTMREATRLSSRLIVIITSHRRILYSEPSGYDAARLIIPKGGANLSNLSATSGVGAKIDSEPLRVHTLGSYITSTPDRTHPFGMNRLLHESTTVKMGMRPSTRRKTILRRFAALVSI